MANNIKSSYTSISVILDDKFLTSESDIKQNILKSLFLCTIKAISTLCEIQHKKVCGGN